MEASYENADANAEFAPIIIGGVQDVSAAPFAEPGNEEAISRSNNSRDDE